MGIAVVVGGICALAALGFGPGGPVDAQNQPTQTQPARGGERGGTHHEVTSALGRKFYSLPDEKGVVAAAEKELAADPKNPKLLLKLDQAQVAVWQYREAVETCTRALQVAGDDADWYLERGHREVALREFDKARSDTMRAVTLDPKKLDGYYHLGLAHYFLGEFQDAAAAFQHAVDLAPNDDSRINSTNWLYASLRRANDREAATRALAKIPPDMKAGGHSEFYLHLVRLFQGAMTPQEVLPAQPQPGDANLEPELQFDTVGYGVGNWYLYSGQKEKAEELFGEVVKGRVWITWGFIGAEREVARARG